MNPFLLVEPEDEAQLFDMIHGLFGVGDFDDSKDIPWWKVRRAEISKLRGICRKRQISLADMALTARYCYRQRKRIQQSWQLTSYISDAKKDLRNRKIGDLDRLVDEALTEERFRDDTSTEWVGRLLRARGAYRRRVLDEW